MKIKRSSPPSGADMKKDTEAVTHFTPVDTSKIKDWRER